MIYFLELNKNHISEQKVLARTNFIIISNKNDVKIEIKLSISHSVSSY